MYVLFDERWRIVLKHENIIKFEKRSTVLLKREFDTKPVESEDKKTYEGKMLTNFHKDVIPDEGSLFSCFLIILIGSVFKKNRTIILKYF